MNLQIDFNDTTKEHSLQIVSLYDEECMIDNLEFKIKHNDVETNDGFSTKKYYLGDSTNCHEIYDVVSTTHEH